MKDGALDAFFFVGGFPAGAISELATSGGGIELVNIAGPEIDKMRKEYAFFATDKIPADTYKGVGAVDTLSVGAQWVTSAKQPTDLIYAITKALWNANTRKLRPRQGQGDHKGDRAGGSRHPAASRRREVLQGSWLAQVT
jgi:TRAP transporter TAXI family solute receptor